MTIVRELDVKKHRFSIERKTAKFKASRSVMCFMVDFLSLGWMMVAKCLWF
jgi:hypothetical protein